jgi:hypothetical protein
VAPITAEKKVRLAMEVVVSLAVLISALAVLISNKYDDTYTKWATGAVGFVLGYWLR